MPTWFNLAEMARLPYQVAGYQPVLLTVDSLTHLAEPLHAFLEYFDETTQDRYRLPVLPKRGFMARPGGR
ncbi:hypothetical protein [Streptomyces sp. NPDC017993]|uniref:hypothetical protein n=1 Tax=Streptomyces sp. NPDC017993 TaxID=3365027 RepID=UPI00378D7426